MRRMYRRKNLKTIIALQSRAQNNIAYYDGHGDGPIAIVTGQT